MSSYADDFKDKNPVQYEKSRLVIDTASELQLALEDAGLTKSDLARRLQRGRAIVSRQLRGAENLSLGKLAELAYHLGKRFEFKLVDIAQESDQTIESASGRKLTLVWCQPVKGEFRVSVPEQAERIEQPTTKHSTAA